MRLPVYCSFYKELVCSLQTQSVTGRLACSGSGGATVLDALGRWTRGRRLLPPACCLPGDCDSLCQQTVRGPRPLDCGCPACSLWLGLPRQGSRGGQWARGCCHQEERWGYGPVHCERVTVTRQRSPRWLKGPLCPSGGSVVRSGGYGVPLKL